MRRRICGRRSGITPRALDATLNVLNLLLIRLVTVAEILLERAHNSFCGRERKIPAEHVLRFFFLRIAQHARSIRAGKNLRGLRCCRLLRGLHRLVIVRPDHLGIDHAHGGIGKLHTKVRNGVEFIDIEVQILSCRSLKC